VNPIFGAALEVQAFCRAKRWKFCFIGALAVQPGASVLGGLLGAYRGVDIDGSSPSSLRYERRLGGGCAAAEAE